MKFLNSLLYEGIVTDVREPTTDDRLFTISVKNGENIVSAELDALAFKQAPTPVKGLRVRIVGHLASIDSQVVIASEYVEWQKRPTDA